MLLDNHLLAQIESGEITVLFRRWRRPGVRTGTRQRTPIGLVEVVDLSEIEPDQITATDVRAAGYDRLEDLMEEVDRWPGRLHRVEVRFAGPDPRVALRRRAHLEPDELAELSTRLDRMDARADLPWTRETLRLIGANSGVVSTELASRMGLERRYFKRRVRRLKELGLTESLEVGYRLSPRGEAFLRADGSAEGE